MYKTESMGYKYKTHNLVAFIEQIDAKEAEGRLDTTYYNYFDTWTEAKAFLLRLGRADVRLRRIRYRRAMRNFTNILDMVAPKSTAIKG